MEPDNTSVIECKATIENLNSCSEIVKRKIFRNAELSLLRNEHKEIVISICNKKNSSLPVKYVVRDVKFHCRFLKEGKVTLHLVNQSTRLLLSNCPPNNLKNFCKILAVKLVKEKEKVVVSTRQKILLGLPKALEEISPLNEIDIAKANENQKNISVNKKVDSSTGNKKENFAFRKRKLPMQDITNGPKSENPPKRRMLSLSTEILNAEQKRVLQSVRNGDNLFFTGSAGTGKSFLLRYIVGMLPPSHVFVTASTGVAACQIGGQTLHSFAGIGKGEGNVQDCIKRVVNRSSILRQWRQCKHLIIDEISMIHADFFDKMEKIARVAKRNSDPFGGIQLILCGDFFQLPPVSKSSEKQRLCFMASSWDRCVNKSIELRQVYRQSDPTFIRLLQNIRVGRCSEEITSVLHRTSQNQINNNGILATKLCTHRDDVDHTNKSELENLPGVLVTYHSEDNFSNSTKVLNNALPGTESISFKLGAQVMLTKNIDVSCGLVNGARGVVTGFTHKQNYSMRIPQHQLLDCNTQSTNLGYPVVRFLCGVEKEIKKEHFSLKVSHDVIAVRKQIPLKLAWSISIHKSQGMSLDCVEVSLSRIFECGQAYVALSRARSLQGLRVVDFTPSCVRANLQALRFYRRLREAECNTV